MNLPLHGVEPTLLPPEPEAAVRALRAAVADPHAGAATRGDRLRAVVAGHPAFLDGWAHLAGWALAQGDLVSAYAFARTGYHRGLDRLRQHGWRGQGAVPWHHEPNRGFLRSVRALAEAAEGVGEHDEAQRCRSFLAELDPEAASGEGDAPAGG